MATSIDTSTTTDTPVATPPVKSAQPKPVVALQSTRNKVEAAMMTLYDQLDKVKPVTGRWEYSLLLLLRGILENESQETFETEWSTALAFFNKSKGGLFDIGHILRFGEAWPGSEMEFSLYRRLIWLCSETSAPATRKTNAKNFSLTKVIEGLSPLAANRIIGYYD